MNNEGTSTDQSTKYGHLKTFDKKKYLMEDDFKTDNKQLSYSWQTLKQKKVLLFLNFMLFILSVKHSLFLFAKLI